MCQILGIIAPPANGKTDLLPRKTNRKYRMDYAQPSPESLNCGYPTNMTTASCFAEIYGKPATLGTPMATDNTALADATARQLRHDAERSCLQAVQAGALFQASYFAQ